MSMQVCRRTALRGLSSAALGAAVIQPGGDARIQSAPEVDWTPTGRKCRQKHHTCGKAAKARLRLSG
jgi:hypothetical protein